MNQPAVIQRDAMLGIQTANAVDDETAVRLAKHRLLITDRMRMLHHPRPLQLAATHQPVELQGQPCPDGPVIAAYPYPVVEIKRRHLSGKVPHHVTARFAQFQDGLEIKFCQIKQAAPDQHA